MTNVKSPKEQRVERRLWRGCVKPEYINMIENEAAACASVIKELICQGKLLGTSLFKWENNLFLYYESIDCSMKPKEFLSGLECCLEIWPGKASPRYWVEMVDVFHFNQPANLEHWRRKTVPDKRVGKIGRLKPEMIPHYIFYHYALQEERTFGGDKYEIIGLNENILFGYFELPEVVEKPVVEPRIKTNAVPENWEDAKIPSCFIPWPDVPDIRLRIMPEVLSVW
ncbi:MAG: hypothetical protein ACOX7R_03210 [Acetivibrionales bacterium]|jgi:hypothetical protein